MSAPAVDISQDLLEENRKEREERVKRVATCRTPRWNPKKWHPVYEEVVLLDCLGYKGKDIARLKGFTPQHVSCILNTSQAKMIRKLVLARMEKKREETVEERLERITAKAMDRVEEVMANDTYAEKNPGGIFDRALGVLKAAGKVKQESAGPTNNNLIVSDDQWKMLTEGIKRSDEARRLNSGEIVVGGEEVIHNVKDTPATTDSEL